MAAATVAPWEASTAGDQAIGGFNAAADAQFSAAARNVAPELVQLYTVIASVRDRLIGPSPRVLLKAQRTALRAALDALEAP
jgi:hypothetical protein